MLIVSYLPMIGFINTCLTIKSDVYEAFVNPEESFWEGLFMCKLLRIDSYIYASFMNEAQYFRKWKIHKNSWELIIIGCPLLHKTHWFDYLLLNVMFEKPILWMKWNHWHYKHEMFEVIWLQ